MFLALAVMTVAAASLVTVAGARLVLGPLGEASIDPRTVGYTFTSGQWIILGASVVAVAVLLCLGLAASIHAADRAGVGAMGALRRIRAKSMQLFWLQLVVFALAARFSPWAALLLWVMVGFAITVAVCENLGPSDAVDRAWTLSLGARGRILAAELLLPLLPVAALVGLAVAAWPDGPLAAMAYWPRTAVLAPAAVGVLMLVQFVFVALTSIYQALVPQPVLHVRVASNVSS